MEFSEGILLVLDVTAQLISFQQSYLACSENLILKIT